MLDHRDDARLLQHDFRDPHSIRTPLATPWKIAAIEFIPSQQSPLEIPSPHRVVHPHFLFGRTVSVIHSACTELYVRWNRAFNAPYHSGFTLLTLLSPQGIMILLGFRK